MPGPVVNGVRQVGALGQGPSGHMAQETVLPLISEGRIRLLLLSSGEVLMASLRNTTDQDGDHAYQLIRPRLVQQDSSDDSGWSLHPYLLGLTTQSNVVLFKSAVASVLDPDPLLMQAYAEATNQECPLEETPVERLKRAFQEFTESVDANQSLG